MFARSAVVALLALSVIGCGSDRLQAYPDRAADTAVFCSEACMQARRTATCGTFWNAVPTNSIEDCLRASCPVARQLCEGDSADLWEPSCYVACARMESQEVQDAVADALDCAVPPACR